jgi:hypothetical protein
MSLAFALFKGSRVFCIMFSPIIGNIDAFVAGSPRNVVTA